MSATPAPARRFSVLAALRAPLDTLWANPVVVRDLRAQMRGARTYWQLAAFLLMLSLLSVAGYSLATREGGGIVFMQRSLQQFYQFIFMTLAALISLIAPALTATSITEERQRGTLDMLVSTPLSAAQLLAGKLISSVAYLLLLLSLSLPASALCVMLGGATIGDVFSAYLLLAIDGLLMAAIGLYYSCATRTHFQALAGAYGSVWFLTMGTVSVIGFGLRGSGGAGGAIDPIAAVGALNPFAAITFAPSYFAVGGIHVPIWVGTAIAAFALIRLLSAASALRLGFYGEDSIGPLRRQVLLLTALIGIAVSYAFLGTGGAISPRNTLSGQFYLITIAFLVASSLMPALFVPAVADDAPAGTTIRGGYRLRQAFGPEHAGALPYFHLWLAVLALSSIGTQIAMQVRGGLLSPMELMGILLYGLAPAFYVSGLGFLIWCMSRRASTLTVNMASARSAAFGLIIVLAVLPMMVLSMMRIPWDENLLGFLWILSPMLSDFGDIPMALTRILGTGAALYVLGAIIYPPRADVVPGELARRKTRPAGEF